MSAASVVQPVTRSPSERCGDACQRSVWLHVCSLLISKSCCTWALLHNFFCYLMLFVCPLLSVNLSYSWRCCSIYEIKTFLKKLVCGLHSFKNSRGKLDPRGGTRSAAHSWEEWTQTPPTWRSMNMLGYCPFLLLSSIMWSAAVVKRNSLSVRIFRQKTRV